MCSPPVDGVFGGVIQFNAGTLLKFFVRVDTFHVRGVDGTSHCVNNVKQQEYFFTLNLVFFCIIYKYSFGMNINGGMGGECPPPKGIPALVLVELVVS